MTALLEIDQAIVRVGGRTLLNGVSLRLPPGDFVAVVGPNGAGKTSLLRVALGLLWPETGRVSVNGRGLAALSPRERAGLMAWLPQRVQTSEPVTALERVAMARYRFRESYRRSMSEASAALARVGAQDFASRPITELSGGEQQRVAVAALLAQEAPLVLLDEPANFLDPAQQLELYTLVGRLWRSGLGILCVTHDINVLAHAAEQHEARQVRVVGMANGRVIFESLYDAPELGEQLSALFGVRMRAVTVDNRRIFVGLAAGGGT